MFFPQKSHKPVHLKNKCVVWLLISPCCWMNRCPLMFHHFPMILRNCPIQFPPFSDNELSTSFPPSYNFPSTFPPSFFQQIGSFPTSFHPHFPNKNCQGTQVIYRMRLRIHREGIARDEARGNDQRVRARERRRQGVHCVLGHVLRDGGGGNRGFLRGLAMG